MQETVTGEAVDAILSYSASDPHAVWIFFDLGADNPLVGWAFGRDLLNEGLHALAGGEVGEIMIEPDTRSDIVVLYLRSPDGTVVLEADTNDIVAFLNSTARKVPVGTESAIAEGLVIEAVERVLSV